MMSLHVWLPGPMFLLGISVPGPIFLWGESLSRGMDLCSGRRVSVQEGGSLSKGSL